MTDPQSVDESPKVAADPWRFQALAKGKEQLTAASTSGSLCSDACSALLDSFQQLKDAQAMAQAPWGRLQLLSRAQFFRCW